MELTPKNNAKSRLSILSNKSQTNIRDHFHKVNPNRKQESPVLAETRNKPTTIPAMNSSKILQGVVACLDVRTEDGDDVSQNFERALQSMGAKTRRTFSDSVTHLIFKNGSPATLKKALSKKVFIINLLWISRCKKEGKRLPEKEFIIEKPQGLVLTGKKRRKSMEPGKVRALEELETSSSTSSENSSHDDTSSSINWTSNKKRVTMSESEIRKRHIQEAEAQEGNGESLPPRLSLPISLERHKQQQKSNKSVHNMIPVHAPSSEKQEQIKARFSIGQVDTNNNSEESTTPRTSLPSSSSSPLIKRKRRLTGSLSRPPMLSSSKSTK